MGVRGSCVRPVYLADLLFVYAEGVTSRLARLSGAGFRAPSGRFYTVVTSGHPAESPFGGNVEDHRATFAEPLAVPDDLLVAERAITLLGWRAVEEVTRADIVRVRREIAAKPGALVADVDDALAVLSEMFALAIRLGWRRDNPCKNIELIVPKTWGQVRKKTGWRARPSSSKRSGRKRRRRDVRR